MTPPTPSSRPLTLTEKILSRHAVGGTRPLTCRTGDYVEIRPRHVMSHDNTSAVIAKFCALGALRIHDPRQPVIALDHDIQNNTPETLGSYAKIERFAREHGLAFYPAGSGIGHQIMIERGYARPGTLVVASDSHANMYGAVGCLGTPVVRTDAAAIWATGSTWWRVPPVARVHLHGAVRPGVTGKDLILTLCALVNQDQVLNHAVEFVGGGIASLSMPERMAIANMTTEWGALAGIFPVDDRTREYLAAHRPDPESVDAAPSPNDNAELAADPDAEYAVEIDLDLAHVAPMVTGPNDVKRAAPIDEIERRRIRITKAYIVSCVNARYADLAAAASVLRSGPVAAGVELYIAAASVREQQRAERDGVWQALLTAGAIPLPSGCGPCIGLGRGVVQPGDVAISATNRNYRGRMGSPDAQVYLASPAVVAASAQAGYIRGPERSSTAQSLPQPRIRIAPGRSAEQPALIPGFPKLLTGRALLLPRHDISTDAIFAGRWTYVQSLTPADLARVAFENYDTGFQTNARRGDILVAGRNFGAGSSREQAATALQAFGIKAVIAASFSATYERNALNNGLLILESPGLAEALLKGRERPVECGPEITIDFVQGRVRVADSAFEFAPLGSVAQALIVARGIEAVLRARAAGRTTTPVPVLQEVEY